MVGGKEKMHLEERRRSRKDREDRTKAKGDRCVKMA